MKKAFKNYEIQFGENYFAIFIGNYEWFRLPISSCVDIKGKPDRDIEGITLETTEENGKITAVWKTRSNLWYEKVYTIIADEKGFHYTFNIKGEGKISKIRYFVDGETYNLQGYKTLVIGGAYSVDKYYRLQNGAKWFENELLTENEMNEIEKKIIGQQFDFILTHTCPISWEPTDLFLGCVNQSTVDKSMEIWMDRIKDKIKWQIWCFGHFHADRLERPHVEMFFRDTELLENVWQRWEKYRETGELDYWLDKSPNFYMYEVN